MQGGEIGVNQINKVAGVPGYPFEWAEETLMNAN